MVFIGPIFGIFKREFIDKEFLEIGAKRRKDFHSFRHTFTENLKDVEGVQDGALDYINGHYSSSHSQKTYGKRNNGNCNFSYKTMVVKSES